MSFRPHTIATFIALVITLLIDSGARPSAHPARADDLADHDGRVRHVLLISIDGMHALDYTTCVTAGTCPHLSGLGDRGVVYPRTSTAKPSDSFPGLMALVTGGTPRTVGAYSRSSE